MPVFMRWSVATVVVFLVMIMGMAVHEVTVTMLVFVAHLAVLGFLLRSATAFVAHGVPPQGLMTES